MVMTYIWIYIKNKIIKKAPIKGQKFLIIKY